MTAAQTASDLSSFTGRRGGSDAERRAALWLSDRLRNQGRAATIETFWCRPNWALAHAWHAALGVGASVLIVGEPRIGGAAGTRHRGLDRVRRRDRTLARPAAHARARESERGLARPRRDAGRGAADRHRQLRRGADGPCLSPRPPRGRRDAAARGRRRPVDPRVAGLADDRAAVARRDRDRPQRRQLGHGDRRRSNWCRRSGCWSRRSRCWSSACRRRRRAPRTTPPASRSRSRRSPRSMPVIAPARPRRLPSTSSCRAHRTATRPGCADT